MKPSKFTTTATHARLKRDFMFGASEVCGADAAEPASLRRALFRFVCNVGTGPTGTGIDVDEGDGAGAGGGSGGDGQQQSGTAPAGEGSGAGNGKPVTFTQEQVNALTAKARREGRESAQRGGKPAPTNGSNSASSSSGTAAPPKGDDRVAQLEAQLEEERLRRTFDRRADRLGLDDDAADDLFELYKAQRPDDVGAWFDDKVKKFGLGKAGATTTTTSTPNGAKPGGGVINQQQSSKPISDKGTPGGSPREFDTITSPLDLTGGDIERLIAKVGEEKANTMIGEMTMRWLNTATLKVNARKRS